MSSELKRPQLKLEPFQEIGISIALSSNPLPLLFVTGAVTVTSPSNKDAPYGSAGKVISGTELRLVDVESGKDVGEDTPGEVWVKAPVNFACYYRNEKATRETFEGEWFKTGDIGVMKKSGDLFIVDRLKVSSDRANHLPCLSDHCSVLIVLFIPIRNS